MPRAFVKVIEKKIYIKGASSRMEISYAKTFSIRVIVHQNSVLSSYLISSIMDEFIKNIQDKILWCMLFVDKWEYKGN